MGISKGISTSLFITAGFCTMTGFSLAILSNPQALAVDVTGTASANATVTVAEACTMESGGTNDSPHTATIPAGTLKENIGLTTFKVVCNDSEGFSVYAVGFANYEYGNTKLLATISGSLNPTYDIVTGLATSGNTSNWAMKLTAVSGTYAPTIQSDTNGAFSAYHTVPATNTKVATFAGVTDAGSNATGSAFTATYRAFISGTQPAGNYNGKVKYTMVHPASNVPNGPQSCDIDEICYFPNANGIYEGTMGRQMTSADTEIALTPSNFSKDGYGFAGWSDAYDYEANPDAHIYGPQETITTPSSMTNGLSLYAVWVPSQGNLQNWTECSYMNIGSVTALTDQRDNQTYAVARLADGNCWMIENLRLSHTNLDNSVGVLSQGYGGDFVGLANSEASWSDNTTANSLYSLDGNNGTVIIDANNAKYRFPRYNNTNTSNRASSPVTGVNTSIYSYGNYYTWTAVLADTTYYNTENQSVTSTSLCPSGWRLPQGGNKARIESNNDNDFWNLVVDGLNGGTQPANYDVSASPSYSGAAETSPIKKIINGYPNNFIYSGSIYNNSIVYRGNYGYYWSSTSSVQNYNSSYSYSLELGISDLSPGTYSSGKFIGMPIRCLVDS